MKKLFISLVLASGWLSAQDITSVLAAINLIRNPPAIVLTITASQGDGSVLTVSKVPGSVINLMFTETSAAGASKNENFVPVQGAAAAVVPKIIFQGDVACFFIANATATALPVQGSFPAIPVQAVGYQCSTAIRTLGSISGYTAVQSGIISFP